MYRTSKQKLLVSLCLATYMWSPQAASAEADATSAEMDPMLLFYDKEELVTATRTPKSVRKAPAIATVITARDIRVMGARNLTDVLKTVPGFGVSINEQGSLMYEVRGIRTTMSEKILVMVDGHSLNRNYLGSALAYAFDTLPLENVKQIEIIRSPVSALFGANALVATVNIITKDADDITGMDARVGYASFNSKQINLTGGETYTNEVQVTGSINVHESDGAKLTIQDDILSINPQTAAFSKTPGYMQVHQRQADLFLKLLYKNWALRTSYLSKERGSNVAAGFALTDDNALSLDAYWTELSYNANIAEDITSTTKVFIDRYDQDTSIELMPEGFAGSFPDGMIAAPSVTDQTLGGELQININRFDKHQLVGGLIYEKLKQYNVKTYKNFDPHVPPPTVIYLGGLRDISSWGNWNIDTSREIWAAYIQDDWQVKENLNLTVGARYDRYTDIGSSTNPRVGLVWGAADNVDVKLLYGKAFRAPNFIELYNKSNSVVIGNPNLRPERIETYEVGLNVRFANALALSSNYFNNKVKDMIDWDRSTNPPQYANTREADIEGIEMGLNGIISLGNYWGVAYTYQDPRDSETDERLPYVPAERVNGGFTFRLSRNVDVHTQVLWADKRPRMKADTRDDMPAYTTVDLAVTWKSFRNTLELQATIFNLFDEDYSDPDTSGPAGYIPNDFPREGRAYGVNASYQF